MMRHQRFPLCGTLPILMLLGGCVGKSPPVEFFMLEPEQRAASRTGTEVEAQDPVIAVGPIRIPEYLDRPQIVTARGRNAYRLDDQHRWAERLDDNIGRVLVRNLEALVPARQVLANTTDQGRVADFRVVVNIREFHLEPDGQASFSAQWSIRRGSETLLSRTSSLRAAASAGDYGQTVAALNECVNRFSHTVASALREMVAASPVRAPIEER